MMSPWNLTPNVQYLYCNRCLWPWTLRWLCWRWRECLGMNRMSRWSRLGPDMIVLPCLTCTTAPHLSSWEPHDNGDFRMMLLWWCWWSTSVAGPGIVFPAASPYVKLRMTAIMMIFRTIVMTAVDEDSFDEALTVVTMVTVWRHDWIVWWIIFNKCKALRIGQCAPADKVGEE